MKENIYITGHRNPDLDSICSAYAYSVLKNLVDPEHNYVPVRCGHMSESVKKQFEILGITPPPYMNNVNPRVSDVMLIPEKRLEASQPLYDLITGYDQTLPPAIPVFDKNVFIGLLSVDDISYWFLSEGMTHCPEYKLNPYNMAKVIGGTIIHKGSAEILEGALVMGLYEYNNFCKITGRTCKPISIMPYSEEDIRFAIEHKYPAIVISACEQIPELDLSDYDGWVLSTAMDTSETIRRLRLAPDVSNLIGPQGPSLQKDDLYDTARDLLAVSKWRGLSVFDGDEWVGFVTRRCFLKKPVYKVIMVDHNEVGQSIRGIENAEVREIIDHHRLDALKTNLPIFIDAEPLGSTCTIVYQQFRRHGLYPNAEVAKILLAGIMSDTLILRSPTTTQVDRTSAGSLAAMCGELDIAAFGKNMFSCTNSIATRDPLSAINSDFKIYTQNGAKVGIGQCEATTLDDVSDYAEIYIKALDEVKTSTGLDWAMLMITDVITGNSILLVTDSKKNEDLQYTKISDNMYDLKGVMSRKKQLLPEVIHALQL